MRNVLELLKNQKNLNEAAISDPLFYIDNILKLIKNKNRFEAKYFLFITESYIISLYGCIIPHDKYYIYSEQFKVLLNTQISIELIDIYEMIILNMKKELFENSTNVLVKKMK